MKEDVEILSAFGQASTKVQAFEWLVDKYQQQVYWHIRRMVISHDDAADVSQNTFIKVWQHLDKFKHESKLYTWLYRIAYNEAITFLNKKKPNLPIDAIQEELIGQLTHQHFFNGNQIQLKLQEAILRLPEKQRVVFNLKYFENLKYEDMSEILETSVGALKASYHLAVKKLEQYLINPI